MQNFGMSYQTAYGFATMTTGANRTHAEVFGAAFAPPELDYTSRIGVNGDGIVTWEWFAQKLPNAIIINAPYYGSSGCPTGCNSMVKVIDLQEDVVKIGKTPLYIFQDWQTAVPVKGNFLKTIGQLDKLDALDQMVATYPPEPAGTFTPVANVFTPPAPIAHINSLLETYVSIWGRGCSINSDTMMIMLRPDEVRSTKLTGSLK